MQNFIKNSRYEILSPQGWVDFEGIFMNQNVNKESCQIILNSGLCITATTEHRFYVNQEEIITKNLKIGDHIDTINGPDKIINIDPIILQNTYDIFNAEGHKILVNSIASHQCDEFGFVAPSLAKSFWTSVRPTLGKMGKCIITSTPNNDEDQFSQIWKDATKTTDDRGNEFPGGVGKNNFKAIKVIWDRRPDRTREWANNEIAAIGLTKFRREFECEFLTEDEILIDPQVLELIKSRNEISKIGDIRWFSHPEPNKTYVVGLDPATGTGGDAAAIEVFQLPEMIQVAEWRDNNTPTTGQLRILLQILRYIDQTLRTNKSQRGAPEIYWTIENNGMGQATLDGIEETGEDAFPGIFVHEPKKLGRPGSRRKGMSTQNKTKLAACSKFKSLIESGRIEIFSQLLIRELKFYVRSGEGFSAKWGETDNLIAATLLCVRIMLVLQNWDPNLTESLKDDASSDDDYMDPLPVLI
jgi:hypothetical protein